MKKLPLVALTAAAALALAGCTFGTPEPEETPGGVGATLAGTGTYDVPDDAAIGSYELPDNQGAQPNGCTWTLYTKDGTIFSENTGSFVYITDVIGSFETEGCPDWVLFEE
jgi:hypothetical protein